MAHVTDWEELSGDLRRLTGMVDVLNDKKSTGVVAVDMLIHQAYEALQAAQQVAEDEHVKNDLCWVSRRLTTSADKE